VKLAVAGLPRSGKTTIFNILTGRSEEVGSFATRTAVAALPVLDKRLDRIWEEYKPPKKVYPTLLVHDPPTGMKETEAFAVLREMDPGMKETRALAAFREMDILLVVLRAFESESVPYNRPALDPAADAAEFRTRLALSDMQLVEKRLERLEKLVKRPSPEQDNHLKEQAVFNRMLPLIEGGGALDSFKMTPEEEKLVRNYGLLTLKPIMYILNAGEEQAQSPPEYNDALAVFGKLEMEINEMSEDEQETYLCEYGITRCAPEIVSRSYKALRVVTFFTTGDDEVRGWTVVAGTTAREAAGKIHTDMQKGFIKAEVVSYEKFLETGSYREARASAGRLEGKDYIIQDGDIVDIRFNP